MKKKFSKTCCEFAEQQLNHHCEQHGDNCPDVILEFCEGSGDIPDGFGLVGRNADYEAIFCPSCGKVLKDHCS